MTGEKEPRFVRRWSLFRAKKLEAAQIWLRVVLDYV
jgi:hypothetical protein